MTSAYVEHRPLSDDKDCPVTGYVVIVKHPDGETEEVTGFKTQLQAEEWACDKGYTVHVARVRHLQDKPTPAHWRVADCKRNLYF
jgi:hypothetical protein